MYLPTFLQRERPMDGCSNRIFGLFQWRSIIYSPDETLKKLMDLQFNDASLF